MFKLIYQLDTLKVLFFKKNSSVFCVHGVAQRLELMFKVIAFCMYRVFFGIHRYDLQAAMA